MKWLAQHASNLFPQLPDAREHTVWYAGPHTILVTLHFALFRDVLPQTRKPVFGLLAVIVLEYSYRELLRQHRVLLT